MQRSRVRDSKADADGYTRAVSSVNGWAVRPYQKLAHDGVFAQFDAGANSTLVVMPTGTGKTAVASYVAHTGRSRGWKTLFLAHREILINQADETLRLFGLKTACTTHVESAGR